MDQELAGSHGLFQTGPLVLVREPLSGSRKQAPHNLIELWRSQHLGYQIIGASVVCRSVENPRHYQDTPMQIQIFYRKKSPDE